MIIMCSQVHACHYMPYIPFKITFFYSNYMSMEFHLSTWLPCSVLDRTKAVYTVLALISSWHEYVYIVARVKVRRCNALKTNAIQQQLLACSMPCRSMLHGKLFLHSTELKLTTVGHQERVFPFLTLTMRTMTSTFSKNWTVQWLSSAPVHACHYMPGFYIYNY